MHKKDIKMSAEDREIQLDYISIKKKLNEVRKQKNLTQERLSKIAGVQQGRMSTCLNEKNSDFFTFEQMYRICSALDLSMDELVGLNLHDKLECGLTPRKLCEAIFEAYTHFNKYGLNFVDIDIDEEFTAINPPDYPLSKDGLVMQKLQKHAIIFEIGCFPDEKNKLSDGTYFVFGENQTVKKINIFLDHLVKLNKLRLDGSIDNEDFELLVNKRLADIPDV